jgi:prevent-host-death family protein
MALNLKEDIRPISYVKANAADMMNYVNESKNRVVITQNGEARAVLVDIESYQNMQDAFSLLSIFKIAEDEYSAGKGENFPDVVKGIEKEFFQK